MLSVSKEFKTAMKQPVKQLQAYLYTDNIRLNDSDDLISFKISCDTGLCKTAMKKLEVKYLGETNLIGQWVHVGYGVKLTNGTYEYLDYGSFLVTEMTHIKDTGVTTIIGYDKMVSSMISYSNLSVEYPISLIDYTRVLCEACGLELGNETFTTHNDWQINRELWENIEGITYRDILVQIAQVTGSTCIIRNDDKVYFKPLTDTGETLTYDNLFKLKLEPKYGEINSIILARTPQEDNIFMRDEESIDSNGLTEFRIENNEIIDKDRDNAITPIYNSLKGINYYPFEATTEGLGWYEIGDSFNIVNDSGDVFNTSLFSLSITIDGAIKETLKATAESKTQTQYQYASQLSKRLKNTEIIVNKQDQEIKAIITNTENITGELDGIKNGYDTLTQQVEQTMTSTQIQTLISETISNGVESVTTSTGYTFDKDGLNISKSGEEMQNLLDNTGMYVNRDTENILTANNEGVNAINLTARQYLTIGDNSRLENYKTKRTACFYVGGDN